MFQLSQSFTCAVGRKDFERDLRNRVQGFADLQGLVPEPGDRPGDLKYPAGAVNVAWTDWVDQAFLATERALSAWAREATGPAFRTGFLLTARPECGLGRHADCPGAANAGRYEQKLFTLEGELADIATAFCACPCEHRPARSVRHASVSARSSKR